jgi:hypothetical protein
MNAAFSVISAVLSVFSGFPLYTNFGCRTRAQAGIVECGGVVMVGRTDEETF